VKAGSSVSQSELEPPWELVTATPDEVEAPEVERVEEAGEVVLELAPGGVRRTPDTNMLAPITTSMRTITATIGPVRRGAWGSSTSPPGPGLSILFCHQCSHPDRRISQEIRRRT
jgi:hypothetical protein